MIFPIPLFSGEKRGKEHQGFTLDPWEAVRSCRAVERFGLACGPRGLTLVRARHRLGAQGDRVWTLEENRRL